MQKLILMLPALFLSFVQSNAAEFTLELRNTGYLLAPVGHCVQDEIDTCIIDGMVFEIIETGEINGIKAIVKNGRLKIISNATGNSDYRVIRYVFSIRRDENYSSVRHYGDLVSYLVINLLKGAEKGDQFNFEDIIIVDQNKTIIENAVKPIIIKKI